MPDHQTPPPPTPDGEPGRYLDLPVPDAWTPALTRYRPQTPPFTVNGATFHVRHEADLGTLTDACLERLPERVQLILWHRHGRGQTLKALATEQRVTTERILSLERSGRSPRVSAAGRDFAASLRQDVERETIIRLTLGDTTSRTLPDATPDELFRIVAAHTGMGRFAPVSTVQIATNDWLVGPAALLTPRDAEHAVHGHPYFRSADDLAAQLGVPTLAVLAACSMDGPLRLRQNDTVSSDDWTGADWLCAVGNALDDAGIHHFHFSQLVKAVSITDPGRKVTRTNLLGASGITSPEPPTDPRLGTPQTGDPRPERHNLHAAGRTGMWTTARHAHRTNSFRTIVQDVMDAADRPLHLREVLPLVPPVRGGRTLKMGNLTHILSTGPYVRLGAGLYGRPSTAPQTPTREQPTPTPEEAFVLAALQGRRGDTVRARTLMNAALDAKLDPLQIHRTGLTSPYYRTTGQDPYSGVIGTPEAIARTRFERWNASTAQPRRQPNPEALAYGLNRARAEGDHASETRLLQVYAEHGWTVPEPDPAG